MKVLFLAGADQKYGTSRMALSLIRAIKEKDAGIEYIVLTQKRGPINDECDKMNVENYVVPYRYCMYAPLKNKALDFIKRNLKRFIISINNIHAIMVLNRYVNMDDVDIIHTNNNRDLFGAILQKIYHKGHIIHLREFSKAHFGLEMLYPRQIEFMNAHTDTYIAISEAVRNYWITNGVNANKVRTAYDGVEIKSIQYQEERAEQNTIQIVMCGNISKLKGQMQLVYAINRLKREYEHQILVDIYGEGNEKDTYYSMIQQYVRENGMEKMVRFLGYQKDIRKKLFHYDIGINCSKSEGFGLSTVEYMLAGVCPVVSDTGANKELVVDGKTGLVYKYGDIGDLTSKIQSLINDKEWRATLSREARRRAVNNYSLENCVDKTVDMYNDERKRHECKK